MGVLSGLGLRPTQSETAGHVGNLPLVDPNLQGEKPVRQVSIPPSRQAARVLVVAAFQLAFGRPSQQVAEAVSVVASFDLLISIQNPAALLFRPRAVVRSIQRRPDGNLMSFQALPPSHSAPAHGTNSLSLLAYPISLAGVHFPALGYDESLPLRMDLRVEMNCPVHPLDLRSPRVPLKALEAVTGLVLVYPR